MTDKTRNAYFAGLIDGEGYLSLQPVYDHRHRRLKPVIEVKMTCEKTVRALQQQYSGTVFARKPGREGWKPQWRWRVTGKTAIHVIEQIHPFLITKLDSADTLLAYCK